jgi:hypothetical protein
MANININAGMFKKNANCGALISCRLLKVLKESIWYTYNFDSIAEAFTVISRLPEIGPSI